MFRKFVTVGFNPSCLDHPFNRWKFLHIPANTLPGKAMKQGSLFQRVSDAPAA